jgi:uncharacterized protein (TIGR03118 family)
MRARHGFARLAVALAVVVFPVATSWAGLVVTNLVTDDQSVNPAAITDPNLKNSWGISHSPSSPFWVSDNGTGKATLYNVNPATNVPSAAALVVTIPGDGTVTGGTFGNVAGSFNGDVFLFVNEDGTVSGWRGALGTTAETLALASAANVYKGATLATIGTNAYLYAANFRAGSIDVYKGNAAAPDLAGRFTDPGLPSGYAPFNVQLLGSRVFVTYALQDAAKHDDVAGPGNGIVSSFDVNGNFLGRVATAGVLNSPWGLVIAPSSFGTIGGDLLVGNFGDGTINAFNSITFANDGPLVDASGRTIAIDGLWGLIAGNGTQGSANSIFFTAGSNGEQDGLFGSIAPVPEPSTCIMLFAGGVALGAWRLRRRVARSGDRPQRQ